MPPSAKVSKEDILNVAFQILKNENLASITVRRLAKELNCSTHPIYQCFKNMDDLYNELHSIAAKYFKNAVHNNIKESDSPWLELGVSYVQTAYREKNIYRFLYVEQARSISNIEEFIGNFDTMQLDLELSNSADTAKQTVKDKNELHLMVRIFTQGLASIANNCEEELDEAHIRKLLKKSFELF